MMDAYQKFQLCKSLLEKYIYLYKLLCQDEIIFFQLVSQHLSEMLPIIYTPTVGEVCQKWSYLNLPTRGVILSYSQKDQMEEILSSYADQDIEVIVVTDGERVLGLGDLGLGGIAISIGKLSLYTLFGKIHPKKTLPIVLDVGTNRQQLLQDPTYKGDRYPRIAKDLYDALIGDFIRCVKKIFPKALLQWEDFGKENARRLLYQYRSEILSFNDDIQGTAAVSVGAIMAAVRSIDKSFQDLRIVIVGGGSAGIGIADGLVLAMQDLGMQRKEAQDRIYIVDKEGLIQIGDDAQKPFAKTDLKGWTVQDHKSISLLEVIKNVKPDVLIGVSGQGGAFTEEVIIQMHQECPRPIIFPLSNPNANAEASPSDLIYWTKGSAIIATGSPFPPVHYQGKKWEISQCNNVYIFPGLGLGCIAMEAKTITDAMLLESSKVLAQFTKADATGILPSIQDVSEVCYQIALKVAAKAVEEGVTDYTKDEIASRISQVQIKFASDQSI